jgi:hypothetical protein
MNEILNDLEDMFNEVKDQEGVFTRVPDGEYLANLADIVVGESKSGSPMVTMVFEITNGEHEGKQHRKFLMLTGKDEMQTKQNLNRFATEVKKLGVDTSKGFNNTIEQLPNFVDTECKIEITTTVSKQGKEFVNTSFEVIG